MSYKNADNRSCFQLANNRSNHKYFSLRRTSAAILIAFTGLGLTPTVQADFAETAFNECPAKAFLTQGRVPKTYAINLVTGDYQVVAEHHGLSRPLNGVGFNTNDHFIYGWSYEHNQPARIHNNWLAEPLWNTNITNSNFYVGDVDSKTNKYYVYGPSGNLGLYSIGLDPEAADFEKMVQVVAASDLKLSIADMAFHPDNGYLYAVERSGDLWQIDVTTKESRNLGNVGERGIFGAAYFDPDGNLYVGRNNDGAILKININSGDYTAQLFAIGPKATTNDGSRCASAPIIDADDVAIDFGDAPDTYGSTIASNGARHGLKANPALFLGDSVDGESDSSFFPLSDDDNNSENDEDGIEFISNIVERENAIVMVKSSQDAYLNAWIDVNLDGQFDDKDHVLTDYPVSAGKHPVYMPIPDEVTEGKTWARFRLSTSTGLEPTGGVADGEVEDYQVKVLKNPVTITHYPSKSGWTTVAYEDNWPLTADYDMNDVVFYLRTATHTGPEGVVKVEIDGELAAVGATYHNGFAIRLPDVPRSAIDVDGVKLQVDGRTLDVQPLESNRNEAILIITEDTFDFVDPGNHCAYYRTQHGCEGDIEMSFSLTVPFRTAVNTELSGVYDPFIFATPGKWHGDHFAEPPGRSYEVHMKNQAPTEGFNKFLFSKAGQDVSSPDDGLYFLTEGGMPWAMEIGDRWNYPVEFTEVSLAYPKFRDFSLSNGLDERDWFKREKSVNEHTFEE